VGNVVTLAIIGILAGLFFSAFFSGAETGLYCLNRVRLHLGVQRKEPNAIRIATIIKDDHGALSVTLLGTNLANYITTISVAILLTEGFGLTEHQTEIYTVIFLTPVVFVFGEVVPKNLFQRNADTLMLSISRLLTIFDRLFRVMGVVAILKSLSRWMERMVSSSPTGLPSLAPKHRIAFMLREALASEDHAEEQSELIDRICRLSETPLHAVMVPRNKVLAVKVTTDRKGLIRVIRRTGHARLPVFERSPKQIVGVVSVDELLRDQAWNTLADRLMPPLTFSPHETVSTAIVRLQREKQEIAVVIDRGGEMLGVVILKDLLSRVVGDWVAGV